MDWECFEFYLGQVQAWIHLHKFWVGLGLGPYPTDLPEFHVTSWVGRGVYGLDQLETGLAQARTSPGSSRFRTGLALKFGPD